MVTDQNHSSDSSEIRALKKQLEDYHFEYVKLKRKVNLLEAELEDLDKCIDRKTVLNLIHEIIPSLIGKKGPKGYKSSFYLSDSSEESDLVEIIEGPHRVQVREKKDVPHKQRKRT